MAETERLDKLVEKIYALYGSDSGYLFGIPPCQRPGVAAVIRMTARLIERAQCEAPKGDTP